VPLNVDSIDSHFHFQFEIDIDADQMKKAEPIDPAYAPMKFSKLNGYSGNL